MMALCGVKLCLVSGTTGVVLGEGWRWGGLSVSIPLPRGQLFSEHSTDNPKSELGFFIFCKCDFCYLHNSLSN